MGRASWLATATVLLGRVSRVTSPRFTIFSRFESQNGFQMCSHCTAILGFLPHPYFNNHGLPIISVPKIAGSVITVLVYPHEIVRNESPGWPQYCITHIEKVYMGNKLGRHTVGADVFYKKRA